MFYTFEVGQCLTDILILYSGKIGRDTGSKRIIQIVRTLQGKPFLFHIEGYRFIDFHFSVFYVCDDTVFFYGRERIEVGAQPMFCQFALDDRVIVPENEGIFRCLVLRDAELGVHIILHLVIITVQMIGCDVHQYGNVGAEVVHVIQLERTKFNYIIIMLFRCHLQGKAVADVSRQAHIQSCTLENMVNERGGSGLTVRPGNTNHFSGSVAPGKLYLRDNGRALFFQFQYHRSIVGDTGTFHHLISVQNQFLCVLSLFPGNVILVQQCLVLVFDG